MNDYRPFHLPECPARDPRENVDSRRIDEVSPLPWPQNLITVRACTCPPERFGPGSQPIWEPGDSRRARSPGLKPWRVLHQVRPGRTIRAGAVMVIALTVLAVVSGTLWRRGLSWLEADFVWASMGLLAAAVMNGTRK